MKLTSSRGAREVARKPVREPKRKAVRNPAQKPAYKKVTTYLLLVIVLSAAAFTGWVFLNTTKEPVEAVPPPANSFVVVDKPHIEETPAPDDIAHPTAQTVNVEVPMGEVVTPGDFLTEIKSGASIASITFITEPDIFTVGEQMVAIAIEDDFGNREVVEAILTILSNDIPPIIEGVRTIESMRGDVLLYRHGVSAHDAFGRPLDIEVDSTHVDLHNLGEYTVIYRAEDIYGLVSEAEATVLIVDVDIDWVNERIDSIFEEIFTEGMSQVDQARAIFTWIKSNVSFIPRAAAPQSAYDGAHRALQDRRGGCTIFSSLSYVMLTRAEIPNLRIDRVPEAPSRHRWNLINPDDLGWHHFDAFPILLGGERNELYMFTAEHAERFTRRMTGVGGVEMYYVYDPELYPEIVYECINCPTGLCN